MRTKATEMFGLELPIFAFSHCRDVVAEVSKAGGMGVLGCSRLTPEELEQELRWIDDHVNGKPYGVNMLMPSKFSKITDDMMERDLDRLFPKEQTEFLKQVLAEGGIATLSGEQADEFRLHNLRQIHTNMEEREKLLDVALRHPIKLVVNALGVPPKQFVDRAHDLGIKVGAMTGKIEHALRQKAAGCDIIIAQGGEAGGHTGTIASMVLWPQVVDAVAPTPVLAAGGVGRGRQMAAALALGTEGVWCGSIWLGTTESEILPELKEQLFKASSEDTIRTSKMTGKGCRWLRSKYTEAWERPGAPAGLPLPYQMFLTREAQLCINRANAQEYMCTPIGQVVGEMKYEQPVRHVIHQMLDEFVDSAARFQDFLNDE
jgi:NAD(P)H-dependent flavin oxidoreductase YrpB (nitropropane dioxygenase family)